MVAFQEDGVGGSFLRPLRLGTEISNRKAPERSIVWGCFPAVLCGCLEAPGKWGVGGVVRKDKGGGGEVWLQIPSPQSREKALLLTVFPVGFMCKILLKERVCCGGKKLVMFNSPIL